MQHGLSICGLLITILSWSQQNPACHGRKFGAYTGDAIISSTSQKISTVLSQGAPSSSTPMPSPFVLTAPSTPRGPPEPTVVVAPPGPSSTGAVPVLIAPPGPPSSTGAPFVFPLPNPPASSPSPRSVADPPAPAPDASHRLKKRIKIGRPLIIGLSVGIVSLMMISVMLYCLARRYSWWESWNADKGSNIHVEEFMRNYGSIAPKLYTFSEIKKIANSFSEELGHGGFGHVYRGKLSDGREVAVKVLNDSKGNGEDFMNEVAAISKTSHVNVVALLGFCCSSRKRALIYEFMPNGSLDKFIGEKKSSHLEWKLLYEIAVGIARGLEYLHKGCNTRIVHFDIKPQNILLDADFCPKISDFGLARLCKKKQSILSTTGPRGTAGYIAPEMVSPEFGGVSHKSDVYSYGMMVLEMVGLTRKPKMDSQQTSENYFPTWIYEHVELGKELPLQSVASEEEKENAMKMIFVGLWCIKTNPSERPSISKVVEMLEGSLQSLPIPPKPVLASATTTNFFNQESWTTSSIS